MELMKEQVRLDQCVGSIEHQIMLEGEVLIPDAKPDMQMILQTEEYMRIGEVEISAERVHFSGGLELSVLYMAKGDKVVHVLKHFHAAEDFVNLDGIGRDMFTQVTADIANIELRMVNDRKVSFRAVVNIRVRAERSDVHDMVVHIPDVPENQLLKSPISVNRTAEFKQERFSVSEQLLLPAGKPNVREVLLVSTTITNSDERLVAGRMNITGELLVTTLYRGETEESVIEFVENTVPFAGAFDLAEAREDMLADCTLQVAESNARILTDDDGEYRVIEVDVALAAQMKVYATDTLNILEDAYCTQKELHLKKSIVLVPRFVCHNRNTASVKEVLTLPAGAPDMLQVFRVRGTTVLDDVKVLDDRVIAEGVITTDILYVASSDEQPLGSYRTVVPFRQVIEAKGARAGMRVRVDTSVDQASFNMLSPREAEVRFTLTFNMRVVEEHETHIVTDINATDFDPSVLDDAPSMTVYVAQAGDNLWSIAKRYNTPLDELLAVNELEPGAALVAGQKLLVLKRAA